MIVRVCPVCGRVRAVNVEGRFLPHQREATSPTPGAKRRCEASGMSPEELAAEGFDPDDAGAM